MNINNELRELYFLPLEPRAYSFKELSDLYGSDIEPRTLRKAIINSRFISLADDSEEGELFILDSVLFWRLVQLNIRLAQIRKFRLLERHLVCLLSSLRKSDRWKALPIGMIHWCRSLGLMCPSYTKGEVVFPLARILSLIKRRNLQIAAELFLDLSEIRIWDLSLKKYTNNALKEGFANYTRRISYIVRRREGIRRYRADTLQEIGRILKLTRERIRQIEEKFWISFYREKYRKPFLKAFLCDLMSNSGSLIIDIRSRNAPLRMFLAKCAGIAKLEFPKLGLAIIGTVPAEWNSFSPSKSIFDHIKHSVIAGRLESAKDNHFSQTDVKKLAKRIASANIKSLSKLKRVYFALKEIGGPAHYARITEVHNSLFPTKSTNEHSIHTALCREKCGIVWIGIRGTYALKEWGYERPKMPLFDTVAEIVRSKYQETQMPVPINIIMAEVGKYRRVVRPSSLMIAIHCNQRIKKVFGDTFMPREQNDLDYDEISLAELDLILKKFEKTPS